MVGPMWNQLQSAELSFLPSGMLKGRLTRRLALSGSWVVRAGWGHAPSLAGSREPVCQAVISAITGALRLRDGCRRPAGSCPRSGLGARQRLPL